jgi:hypothetical protein
MRSTFQISLAVLGLSLFHGGTVRAFTTNDLGAQHQIKLLTQRGYLPGVPVLVRVEVGNASGGRERDLWDADATLSADQPGVALSTNRVQLRNGMGSTLVAFTGGADFNLTARVGALQATHSLTSLTNVAVTTIGGSLPGSTVWSGVIRVTNDVTIPNGATLTILSNTLVLLDGVASGTTANDLLISGKIESLGTEDQPVTITCGNTNQTFRWGQIRHNSAQASLYRWTSITRAGRAPGEGHTGTAPVIRPSNSTIRFESCNITDHAEGLRGAAGFGTPGKIAQADGSDLTFIDCLFQRARMGPEISSTALLCTNTWAMDMNGPDDADGIYLHDQSAGQVITLSGCVFARGDDDGIDTLGSTITVENCIIRDWDSIFEDAKGISALNGVVAVRRSVIVNSTVGVSAKSGGSTPSTTPVLVTMNNCTLTGNQTNVLANRKSSAVGPHVHFNITNCVLWGGDPVHSDFEPTSSNSTNFTIVYCDLSDVYSGTGNLLADPLFANVTTRDYHLLPYSPCIDSGDPLSALDADGSRADMGAYTFVPPRPVLGSPFNLSGGGFQFVLNAYSNRNYVIESSDTATNWNFLKTVAQPAEINTVTDTTAANSTHRIYRARLAP